MKRSKKLFDAEKLKSAFKPTKKKVIITAIILLAVGTVGALASKVKNKMPTVAINNTDTITRGDVEVAITGNASIEPLERYEIIPMVSGDIIASPFGVGDSVKKGDILYRFDSSTTDISMEKQKISLQQSANNYNDAVKDSEKLTLKAKNSGVVSGLTIKAGQDVSNGTKIADISNTKLLKVELPFTQSQIGSIKVGEAATITSSQHMSTVSGTVTHKSSTSYAGSDGSKLYNVTVTFENPGAFYAGLKVGGSAGSFVSPGYGTVENSDSGSVISEVEGTVSKVYHANGDYVENGAVIATLSSDSIANKIEDSSLSYKNADLSMKQSQKDLEDYSITSPINGTVITKTSKAGDTIDKTNSSTVMMVVADISKLKFNLEIDELDVSKVSVGQIVDITCDALPNEEYQGIITKVSVEGTATNGVTTYTAEVQIDQPGNLRPSMNIDASVIVQSASNVLMVPSEDIKTLGNKNYLFVKDDSETGKKTDEKSDKKETKGAKQSDKKAQGGVSPNGAPNSTDQGAPDGDTSSAATVGKDSRIPNAPDGYKTVQIEIGISGDDYTEIKSGVNEGDTIYREVDQSSSIAEMMGGGDGNRQGGGNGGGGHQGGGGGPM